MVSSRRWRICLIITGRLCQITARRWTGSDGESRGWADPFCTSLTGPEAAGAAPDSLKQRRLEGGNFQTRPPLPYFHTQQFTEETVLRKLVGAGVTRRRCRHCAWLFEPGQGHCHEAARRRFHTAYHDDHQPGHLL